MPHNLFSSIQVSRLEVVIIGLSWFVYFILNTCCLFFFVVAVGAPSIWGEMIMLLSPQSWCGVCIQKLGGDDNASPKALSPGLILPRSACLNHSFDR